MSFASFEKTAAGTQHPFCRPTRSGKNFGSKDDAAAVARILSCHRNHWALPSDMRRIHPDCPHLDPPLRSAAAADVLLRQEPDEEEDEEEDEDERKKEHDDEDEDDVGDDGYSVSVKHASISHRQTAVQEN